MYSIMKTILDWESFTSNTDNAKFTKLISFVNLRGYIYPNEDQYEEENEKLCKATKNSLDYAQKLLGVKGCTGKFNVNFRPSCSQA